MSINYNQGAERAARELGLSGEQVNKQMLKVTTGRRIVNASDDPSAMAIESTMVAYTKSLEQASLNARQAVQVTDIADSSLKAIRSNLIRMSVLADRSINSFLSDSDRENVQVEFNQIKEEINRIANSTSYGNKQLLLGDLTENKAYVGSDVRGVKNISFRSGIVDNFIVTTGEDRSIIVTSIQDPTKTQEISVYKPGEQLYFDQLGVYIDTDKDFDAQRFSNLNTSLHGKAIQYGDDGLSGLDIQGIKSVRFDEKIGDITYDVRVDGKNVTLTNLSNGDIETVAYNGKDKNMIFHKLNAYVTLKDNFDALNITAKHISDKSNFVLDQQNVTAGTLNKRNINLLTKENSNFSAFDFKYDADLHMMTIAAINGEQVSFANVNIDPSNLNSAKSASFTLEGEEYGLVLDDDFNYSQSFDYSYDKEIKDIQFLNGNMVDSASDFNSIKVKGIQGNINHLTGRVFFDNGVIGKRLILESKTGNHMYSLNKVIDKPNVNQNVTFTNDSGDIVLSTEMNFSRLNTQDIGNKVARSRMSGATQDLNVHYVSSNNKSAIEVSSLGFDVHEGYNGIPSNAYFLTHAGDSLDADIEEVSINVNGVFRDGYLISHKSKDQQISVFVVKDANAMYSERGKSTASIALSPITHFQKDSISANLSPLLHGMSFHSNKQFHVIDSSVAKGGIDNINLFNVTGNVSSINSNAVLEFEVTENNMLRARIGNFVSKEFDASKTAKDMTTILQDLSDPSNSIALQFDITEGFNAKIGQINFEVMSNFKYFVGNNKVRNMGDIGEVKAGRLSDYKTDVRSHTFSRNGIDSDQISDVGVKSLFISRSDKIDHSESFEYYYDALTRKFTVARINDYALQSLNITDEMMSNLEKNGVVELRTNLDGYDVVVHLDKNFDINKNILGHSTDDRVKSNKIGSELIEASGAITTNGSIANIKLVNMHGAGMDNVYNNRIYIEYNAAGTQKDEDGKVIDQPTVRFVMMKPYVNQGKFDPNTPSTIVASSKVYKYDEINKTDALIKMDGVAQDLNLDLSITMTGDLAKLSYNPGTSVGNKIYFEISDSQALFNSVVGVSKSIVADAVGITSPAGTIPSSNTLDIGTLELNYESLDKIDVHKKDLVSNALSASKLKFINGKEAANNKDIASKITSAANSTPYAPANNEYLISFGEFVGVVKNINEKGLHVIEMKNNIYDKEAAFKVNYYSNGALANNPNALPVSEYSFQDAYANNDNVNMKHSDEGAIQSVSVLEASGHGLKTFDDSNLYFEGNTSQVKLKMYTDRDRDNSTALFESQGTIDLTKAGLKTVTLINQRTGGYIKIAIVNNAVDKSDASFMSHYNQDGKLNQFAVDITNILENDADIKRIDDFNVSGGMLSNILVREIKGSIAGIADDMTVDLTDASKAILKIQKITGDAFVGQMDMGSEGAVQIALKDKDGNEIMMTANIMSSFKDTDGKPKLLNLRNLTKSIVSTYDPDNSTISKSINEIDSRAAEFTISIGANPEDITKIAIDKIDVKRLNINDSLIDTKDAALAAKEKINLALDKITDVRSTIGAYQSRLINVYRTSDAVIERVKNAISDLVDLDAPKGYTALLNDIIRMEGISQMLAKAFKTPRMLSQLLQSLQ